ncbi:MAG: hypothetical protein CVV44_05010 [Spirochaetae bacterium HGW-Spirochaetae-1]|jgi:hypothetical protein|nr:MAG: hypothetical protein CVV44_05010 [Spirochaetae bacterium HGW-Spirochaetae-1]
MVKGLKVTVLLMLFMALVSLGCSGDGVELSSSDINNEYNLISDDSCEGCSGQLDSTAARQISEALTEAGAEDARIALNVRVTVPMSENPKSSGDCDLWATIIRPAGDKKLPTILIAAPYRRELCVLTGIGLVSRGYNVMAVDIRGTGTSSGEWASFDLVEQYDIRYVVDRYIPARTWSDGTVGMFGMSYLAIIQVLTAGLVDLDPKTGEPKHLKAIFPIVPMSDAYRDIVAHGGNLDLAFIPMWLGMVDMLAILPPTILLGVNGELTPAIIDEAADVWLEHWNYVPETVGMIMDIDHMKDGYFYDAKSPMIYWPQKPVGGWGFPEGDNYTISSKLPVFTVGGWFDIFTRGTLNNYQYGFSKHATSDKKMLIGEYYHMSGSAAMGINSTFSGALPGRWFDWKIKGKDDPFMEEFPVILYVMGENKWRAEKSWPLPASRVSTKALYLTKFAPSAISGDWYTEDEDGEFADNNFSLSTAKNVAGDNPVLVHKPIVFDPNMNLNGANSRSAVRWGAGANAMVSDMYKFYLNNNIDEKQWYDDERTDEKKCLTFTTEPLSGDMEIVGPVTLKFWAKTEFGTELEQAGVEFTAAVLKKKFGVESNLLIDVMKSRDVQWVSELTDVFPDGHARNVSSGWLAASHRQYDPTGLVGTYVDENGEETAQHALDPDYVPFDPFYDRPDKNPLLINEGDLYQYCIELWPTCNVFKKGHRVRVSISASDFPHLLPFMQPSTNTIVIDDKHEARIDFSTANKNDENDTWEWVGETKDMDKYLMSGGSIGCGTSADAAVYGRSGRNMPAEMVSFAVFMLFPLGLIMLTRKLRRRAC